MKVRAVLTGLTATFGVVIVGAAIAWACTSTNGPFVSDVIPDRSPVGSTVALKGGGWQSATAVDLGWMAQENGVLERFATVNPATDGSFAIGAPVPSGPAGLFFVVATQGDIQRRMPFELSGASATLGDGTAATGSGLGQLANDAEPASSGSASSFLPIAVIAAVGLLAVAGVATAETRRRRARAHS